MAPNPISVEICTDSHRAHWTEMQDQSRCALNIVDDAIEKSEMNISRSVHMETRRWAA
jgi:hypothetical protein